MIRTRVRKNSEAIKTQSYNAVKEELQNQNAKLMKQRQRINNQIQGLLGTPSRNSIQVQYRSKAQEMESTNPQFVNAAPNKNIKPGNIIDTVRGKVEEVIQLCQGGEQNTKAYGQLNEIVLAEKQILNFLNQIGHVGINTIKYRNSSSSKLTNSYKKKPRLNKTQADDSQQNQIQGIRQHIGEQAMDMIQEIEHKALMEIENLRMDKINLLKRLNDEIKAHNQEKRLRMVLETQNMNIPDNQNRSMRKEHKKEQKLQNKQMEIVREQNQNQQNQELHHQSGFFQSVPQQQQQFPIQHQFNQQQHHQQQMQQQQRPKIQSLKQIRVQPPLPVNQQAQIYYPSQPIENLNLKISQSLIDNNIIEKREHMAEHEILEEIEKLKKQNRIIQDVLSKNINYGNSNHIVVSNANNSNNNYNTNNYNSNTNNNNQIKQQLTSQLHQLQSKIQQYQGIVSGPSINNSRSKFDMKQFNNLLAQGKKISQDGNKLLFKKNSELKLHRNSSTSNIKQVGVRHNKSFVTRARSKIMEDIDDIHSKIVDDYGRLPQQTFSPLDRSGLGHGVKDGYSVKQYENIIQEMKQVMRD